MNTFVVDNNVFSRSFKNLPLSVFDEWVWDTWSQLITQGCIISVDEVYEELMVVFGNKSEESAWLQKHRICFQPLTNTEGYILAEIFRNKKFCEGVKETSIRFGSPEADAILVAKAKSIENSIVVTAESNKKPNSEKIPNICTFLSVPYIGIDDFYRMLKNVAKGIDPLSGVNIQHDIEI